ncbi:LytR family transcriptional regulator [Nocardioides mangrovicus]|uniref:LytR family transcriptional regulator n=1 Tax=Nocardioides mangrovicus TaxID=2478913 RepID=A0A3L8NYQ2_9ACTN|nr:LCP family protein [Nocardioides mangrovicus]RLV47787.1 LytR family transcriptional regulator [Nocardioides mangrovicus]
MGGRPEATHRAGARRLLAPRSFGRSVRWTIGVVVVPMVVLGIVAALYVRSQGLSLARFAVVPSTLMVIAVASGLLLVAWLTVLLATYMRTRPLRPTRPQRFIGAAMTMVLGVLVTAPLATTSYYSMVQRQTINAVVTNEHTATTPTIRATKKSRWGNKKRVNVLLLGGDGGVGRTGIRTDSVELVSIDTRTGRTVMFGLPRNLRNVPFPKDSPLHAKYPDGFIEGSSPGESMLNAIYRNVPAYNPGILGKSDNEGADAVKEAVEGALGIPVDYYVLVNLHGFQQIVDAIGGITVNVNYPVPINGNDDKNIPPTGYIEPGANQHLDGFHALWFTRGRYGLSDYLRMDRQRCAIQAIVDEASPARLLERYTRLAHAAQKIMRTDIPQRLLPAFVELALKMKQQPLRSVVFSRSAQFDPNDPDFSVVHQAVYKALYPRLWAKHHPQVAASSTPSSTPSASPSAGATSTPTDSTAATSTTDDCGYHPETDAQADSSIE